MTNPPYILNRLEGMARCMNHPRMYAFIHVPVQSGSSNVLNDMKREYSREEFERVCDVLSELVPDVTLATDIICGFPTEDEDDFQETMSLVRKYQFAVCNISQFYPRPGTPAARMKLIKTQVVKDRSRRLSQLFNDGIDPYTHLVGTTQRVWINEVAHDKHNLAGHTKNYVQVLVSPAEAAMGTDCMCEIYESGRFFVRGRVVKTTSSGSGSSWKWLLLIAVALIFLAIYLGPKFASVARVE